MEHFVICDDPVKAKLDKIENPHITMAVTQTAAPHTLTVICCVDKKCMTKKDTQNTGNYTIVAQKYTAAKTHMTRHVR